MKQRYDTFAVCWAIVILILCSIPGREIPKITFIDWPDKIVHFLLFAAQSFFLLKSFSYRSRLSNVTAKVSAVMLTISYGVLTELLQNYFFIDRTGDYSDAIADAIGAFTGLWIFSRAKLKQNE
jgi:VanZ family protein